MHGFLQYIQVKDHNYDGTIVGQESYKNNYYDGQTSVKINHLGGCGYRV